MSNAARRRPLLSSACCAVALLLLAVPPRVGLARTQEGAATAAPLSADAVATTLEFLASDLLRGRDTPSRGQRDAARYLADRFREAGLEGMNGSYIHSWQQDGWQLDAEGLAVSLTVDGQRVDLVAGDDVRRYSGAAAYAGTDVALQRLATDGNRRGSGRGGDAAPVLYEVDADSPLWQECARPREVLKSRRDRAVLLVRKGLLPAGDLVGSVSMPAAAAVAITLENVVAMRRGSTRPDQVVLFGGHYDHIGIGYPKDGDAIFNGADDDASGTTAVVQLAQAFAALDPAPQRSVAFVCFSGEEKGLLGSRAFCEAPPLPLAGLVAMLNIEMIGRPPAERRNTTWITGPRYSDLPTLLRLTIESAGVKVADGPAMDTKSAASDLADRLFSASDNVSFARKGVVAHSFSSSSLHEDYPGLNDEYERIDVESMTRVIQALFAAGRALADSEVLPAYSAEGRKVLGLDPDDGDGDDGGH